MAETPAKIIRLLGASFAIALSIAAFNFLVDPLQLFGHRGFYRPLYTSDSRWQNAGLIRSQDYDAVLMGTSLAVHFRQSDIDRKLSVRSLKLAMSGSSSVEQSFVLDAALRRHPKLVIWELDDWIFFNSPDIDADVDIQPDLYRMNLKGIAEYLFSLDTARESLWIVLGFFKPLAPVTHGLAAAQYLKFYGDQVDEINALPLQADLSSRYNSNRARSAFAATLKYPRNVYARYDCEALVRNFERDFFGLIRDHPEVEFRVFFPPYSVLEHVAMGKISPDALQTVYDFSAYVIRRLVRLPNVTVFDFRDVRDITHNLDNYADLIHHSPVVDLKVLSFLANGEHIASRDAPAASIERLRGQVTAYRNDDLQLGGGETGNPETGQSRCPAEPR
jgi:hypothetical protein